MRRLALLFRDRRDELFTHWQSSLKGVVDEEYREVLESPIGARLVRTIVENLVTLAQSEAYEIPAMVKVIETQAANDAAGRARLGFELSGVVAALQLVRAAMWKILGDAVVVGELPPFGETMDEMRQIDAFLDRMIQVEVKGYLDGQQAEQTGTA